MADLTLDPRLISHSQPYGESATLPSRSQNRDDEGCSGSDYEGGQGFRLHEGDEGAGAGAGTGKKRRKLNLWKCKQCREARKKCLPEDRTWPGQKCDRCRKYRPGELECSKPEMNTRTRGKNAPKDKDTTTIDARRSNTASTPGIPESQQFASDKDDPENEITHERPGPTAIKKTKRERPETVRESLYERAEPVTGNDHLPAAVYLPLKDQEFRILQLKPGKKEDMVECSLLVESIDSPPAYEAISYLWGGDNEGQQLLSREIVLFDNRDPPKQHPIFIRSNLHSALRNLRHRTEMRSFWVDALCIQRSNKEEKNTQVDMKKKIFYRAQNLCFWLGDEPAYGAALSFIGNIIDLKGVDKLVDDPNMVDNWLAFIHLLKNNVFSRLWLVQEVAIARNVTLHCGAPAIHYTDFVDAVTIFLSCRKHISALFRLEKKNEKHIRALTDRKISIVERFVDVTTNALRRVPAIRDQMDESDEPEEKVQRLLDLEALVSNLSDLSSGDPKDRIYSVLALAKDGPLLFQPTESTSDKTLVIDYEKSIVTLYQEFFLFVVKKSKTLDIMCRRWASSVPEKENLPTWIRPLQSDLQLPFDSNVSERTDADSLVGTPDHRWYNAAKNTKATFLSSDDKKQSLFVKGFRLDTISSLGQRASEGFIFYEWLQLGGCKLEIDEGDYVPGPFWRTLVADRGPNGSHAPSWYHRALLYCLAEMTPNGDINTNRLIATCEAGSTLVVDFLQRVQSVIWNRKFLVSEDKSIGLAPMAAQERDVICILYGCSVPVVLREKRWKGQTFWQFVGECYVHGKMDGEAMEGRDPEDPRMTELFEIR